MSDRERYAPPLPRAGAASPVTQIPSGSREERNLGRYGIMLIKNVAWTIGATDIKGFPETYSLIRSAIDSSSGRREGEAGRGGEGVGPSRGIRDFWPALAKPAAPDLGLTARV